MLLTSLYFLNLFKVYHNEYVYSAFRFLGAGIRKFNSELGFDIVIPVNELFVADENIFGGGVSKQFQYKLHVNSLGLGDDFKGALYRSINGKVFREYDKYNEENRYLYNNSYGYERVRDFYFVSSLFCSSDTDSLRSTTFLDTSFLSYLFRYYEVDNQLTYGNCTVSKKGLKEDTELILMKPLIEKTAKQRAIEHFADKIIAIFVSMRKGGVVKKEPIIYHEPILGKTISGRIGIVR